MEVQQEYYHKKMQSPIGTLQLVVSNKGLVAVLWERDDPDRTQPYISIENNDHPTLLETERQLEEYFAGKRKSFEIPLDIQGSEFQKKVWEALLTIPFGKTKSYGDLARQLGDIKTVRAVGGALHKNPISIIVPCHRVIGASGDLVGFGGGLENKAVLLNIEGLSIQPTLWT